MADASQPSSPSKALVFVRRTSSTVFLWALVTGVFLSRWTWAYMALISLLILIATWEYFRMLGEAKVATHRRFGLILATVYCAIISSRMVRGQPFDPSIDAFAICVSAIGTFILQLRHPIKGIESLLSVAASVFGFVYIVILFSFVTRLLFIQSEIPLSLPNVGLSDLKHLVGLDPDSFNKPGIIGTHSAMLIIWLLAVTKFTDMGAYITGSLIGKHKMIPHVSPAKTWEGFGGAIFFSQLAGIGLFLAYPKQLAILGNLTHVIILGVILALLAVVGDLAESIVKRAVNAKDSGRMLPGIGGSLDLIDSICFTAPALYFYLKCFLLPIA
jgi:phosphatidate cytidylyltransferase